MGISEYLNSIKNAYNIYKNELDTHTNLKVDQLKIAVDGFKEEAKRELTTQIENGGTTSPSTESSVIGSVLPYYGAPNGYRGLWDVDKVATRISKNSIWIAKEQWHKLKRSSK